MKKIYLTALIAATVFDPGTGTHAAEYLVTETADNGLGDTAGSLSWAVQQANTQPGPDIITLQTDVTLQGVMKSQVNGDLTVQNESDTAPKKISGGNQFRPFFVKSGKVTIKNLAITECRAQGDSSTGGGGGAGLGGALFIYGGSVTVENTAFTHNSAAGGSSTEGYKGPGGGMPGFGPGGYGFDGLWWGLVAGVVFSNILMYWRFTRRLEQARQFLNSLR